MPLTILLYDRILIKSRGVDWYSWQIWETSTHTEQDARFEAPETEAVGSKSTMSDIWG